MPPASIGRSLLGQDAITQVGCPFPSMIRRRNLDDAKWEMQLYGLVLVGQRDAAIRFLQETRGLSRAEAKMKVENIAIELGVTK